MVQIIHEIFLTGDLRTPELVASAATTFGPLLWEKPTNSRYRYAVVVINGEVAIRH